VKYTFSVKLLLLQSFLERFVYFVYTKVIKILVRMRNKHENDL
jgi:hypothetical protein